MENIKLLEYYESIDKAEIDRFIADKQEENLTLEFKTVNHPIYNEYLVADLICPMSY